MRRLAVWALGDMVAYDGQLVGVAGSWQCMIPRFASQSALDDNA